MPTDVGSSCLTGQYLSEDTVRSTFEGRVRSRQRTQRVFPDIHFTCNSTITQWIIGGEIGIGNDDFLELQLWQRVDDDTYIRRSFSTINDMNSTENENVYTYFPNPPLEIQEGDILGVFQPRWSDSPLVIYYQEGSGPFNYGNRGGGGSGGVDDPYTSFIIDFPLDQNDYPLVSVILGEFSLKLLKKLLCRVVNLGPAFVN